MVCTQTKNPLRGKVVGETGSPFAYRQAGVSAEDLKPLDLDKEIARQLNELHEKAVERDERLLRFRENLRALDVPHDACNRLLPSRGR